MANELLEMMRALQKPAPRALDAQLFPGPVYDELDPRGWADRLPDPVTGPGNNRDQIPPDIIMQLFGHPPGVTDENVQHPYFNFTNQDHKI